MLFVALVKGKVDKKHRFDVVEKAGANRQYRLGVRALKEIWKAQKSTKLCVANAPLARLVCSTKVY